MHRNPPAILDCFEGKQPLINTSHISAFKIQIYLYM